MTAWPAVVWDSPLLRALDQRARGELEAAGRIRPLRAGEQLFRVGDPADSLFVVAAGEFAVHGVRRGDSDASLLRRAQKGELLGEEATVAAFATRQLEARCDRDGSVAEVPVVVLKRALGRAGGAEAMAKVERALRRAATLDLLRTASFTAGLSADELDVLLDAATHQHLERGEHLYREGDTANAAFLVAGGLLQAQTGDEGKPRVEAYLSRGDLLGDEELAEREPRRLAVVAAGPSWLVALTREAFLGIARRNPARLEAARRVRAERTLAAVPAAQTTAHVFKDLYRLRVARSLLVIDQDACVRCGHCAWSCADVHQDGVSRLVRRGDTMVVQTELEKKTTAPLLVPNSCQHCQNPSCMIDCPTGAIGRDARGEVFIREELCTGCGSCVKSCPWDNIQLAPRSDARAFPAVAVKCDLCTGVAGGPACVASCPVEAIVRIDPNAALVELGGAGAAPVLPPRTAAWPWVAGAAIATAGIAGAPIGPWTSGVVAGVLVALLVAYAGLKRRRLLASARALYLVHVAAGVSVGGVTVAHLARVPRPGPTAGSALLLAIALAVGTGLVGIILGWLVPRALSRVERRVVLPEELGAAPKEADRALFGALSGKSEVVKTLFAKAIRPYHRARLGGLWLVLSRRTLRAEERALRARLDALTGGRNTDLAGLDELVRLVVETRAASAQRILTALLRGWLVPHLAATVAVVILLALHVVAVGRTPRLSSGAPPIGDAAGAR